MLCFVFAVLVILLDQFIKRWVLLTLALHESANLIPGVIGLTHVQNTGAAFSILADQRWLLIGIACIASLLLIAILLRYDDGFWGTLGLASVLGGTIGNLIDRISYGYVIDIFEFKFMNFAIFNIADLFITLGGITFLIYFIVSSLKPDNIEESVFEDVSEEQITDEYSDSEDRIGLYDFQYDEEAQDREYDGEYEYTIDTGNVTAHQSEQDIEAAEYEPDPGIASAPSENSTADAMHAINKLNELALELEETDTLEEYDINALLREYGFEDDDASQM